MLAIYQLVLFLAAIFAGPFLLVQKKARAGFQQKLGCVPDSIKKYLNGERPIWFHAVSVGEFNAVLPLINKFHARHPEKKILVTTTTATGQQLAFEKVSSIAAVGYFPFDFQPCVSSWLDAVKPELVVIVETEIWPLFTAECTRHGIAIAVVNGRISPRSSRRYAQLKFFFAPILQQFAAIGVQSEGEEERYKSIGGASLPITILGNLKFDGLAPVDAQRTSELATMFNIDKTDFVIVVGSTHEGEEPIVLKALKEVFDRRRQILGDSRSLKLVIAPRHPERFDKVDDLIGMAGFRTRRFSRHEPFEKETDVLLVDAIGELFAWYSLAKLTFIGGSLMPVGGHNLLEPYAYGVPVITGRHLHKTRDLANSLKAREALIVVEDSSDAKADAHDMLAMSLAEKMKELIAGDRLRKQIGERGQKLLVESQGAVDKALNLLEYILRSENLAYAERQQFDSPHEKMASRKQ